MQSVYIYCMKLCIALLFIFIGYTAASQDSTITKKIKLGLSYVKTVEKCFNPCLSNVSFINVHENENTSVQAAEAYLRMYGGRLVKLEHSGERYISFWLKKKRFFIDPNRIYTRTGILATLKKLSTYNAEAGKVVQGFSTHLLKKYVDGKDLVVALHNNSDSNYSIRSYLAEGDEATNATDVFLNDEMDEDDFIVTTDSLLFESIKQLNINVVLQDNKRATDDGSLSIYAAKKGIPYINVEAQQGHYEEQLRMLEALKDLIQLKEPKNKTTNEPIDSTLQRVQLPAKQP